MKQTLLFCALLLFFTNSFAQAPEKMSYQAIIRDTGNSVIASATVGMKISILKGSTSGTVVYTETQTPSTNINGLVSIEFGGGSGFSDIDWSIDSYFIKTETDPSGGSSYTIIGTSQLLSVPYALHAKTTVTPVIAVMTDNTSRTINPPSWVSGPVFSEILGFKSGSKIKLTYLVPSRKGGTNWGGLYIEPQISFDSGSTWNSLGSCGYDGGVMANGAEFIGSYTNTLLIDPQQSANYSVIVRLYYKAYPAGSITINGSHEINAISGTATLMSGDNGLQHYTKVIVEEVFQ